MSRTELVNGETGLSHRGKLNNMFEEIYDDLISGLTFLGILEDGDSVTGSPAQGNYYKIDEDGTYGGIACLGADELYYNGSAWQKMAGAAKAYQELQTRSDGTPSDGDPSDDEISHTLTRNYTDTPQVFLQRESDWDIYVKSITNNAGTVTVVIGIGASGSATTIDYSLYVLR